MLLRVVMGPKGPDRAKLVRLNVPSPHSDCGQSATSRLASALQPNGNGIQSIYLTEVPLTFAEVFAGLIGQEAQYLTSAVEVAGAGSFQLSR